MSKFFLKKKKELENGVGESRKAV